MSAPAKPEAAAEAEAPAEKKGGGSMMPILAAVVLVPGLCFATTQYLLIPKLKAAVAEQGVQPAPAAHAAEKGKGVKEKKDEHDAEFGAVIVNVAGANGSRYLRTNLVLVSGEPKVAEITKASQSALKDAAINVLSSQPLSVLDSPGGKNIVRNELIAAFNKTLGGEIIENIYFSEFVVQ